MPTTRPLRRESQMNWKTGQWMEALVIQPAKIYHLILRLEAPNMKSKGFRIVAMAALLALPTVSAKDKKEAAPNGPVPKLTDTEQEEFLRKGKIIKTKSARKGITNTSQVTLTDGNNTHDAHVQCIDESKHEYKTDRGTELNFRDSYKFNIAGYRLARMLGIENTPVYIERKVAGKSCSVSWWVDDVMMDEATRKGKKIEAPNPDKWNDQIFVMRVFDQLIHNVDRNLTNLLILKNWDIEMIDHSRAFRLSRTLENVKNLGRCDRNLLANLRGLEKDAVMKQLSGYCTKAEVEALMARRDVIVKYYDDQIKQKGEGAVLYDSHKVKSMSTN
jgi:hypothetical protein